MTRPVLVVEHQANCPPGWVGDWLSAAGAELALCRPYAGDALPKDLAAYAGVLVLGGTMSANDDQTVPWLGATKDLLRAAATERVPTLGICLGHQLAAVALGGVVEPDRDGKTMGVQPVGWSAEASADPLLGPLVRAQTVAVQWNNDTVVTPPPGTVELARSARGRLQAARFAPSVWGVQWHPEAGVEVVEKWAALDRPTAAARGLDVDGALAGVAALSHRLQATWRPLARRFAALCAGAASATAAGIGTPERWNAGMSVSGARDAAAQR